MKDRRQLRALLQKVYPDVSKDENLTKSHIRYLEGVLIEKANNNDSTVITHIAQPHSYLRGIHYGSRQKQHLSTTSATMTQIEIYQTDDHKIEIRLDSQQETLWLTQAQMASLLDNSTDNISLHFKNIYAEGELDEPTTTEDFSVVRKEGKRQVKRRLKHYNLDAVLSVG